VWFEPVVWHPAEQLFLGPWLEFVVEDVKASVDRMDKLGLERVEHFDKEHVYIYQDFVAKDERRKEQEKVAVMDEEE
jgi:hypothetical protein